MEQGSKQVVGISRHGCEQAYQALAHLSQHDAEEHRALSLERLSRMRRTLWTGGSSLSPASSRTRNGNKEPEGPADRRSGSFRLILFASVYRQ
jgi:hypothetical protein